MGKTVLFKYKIWSHDWDLNPGPHPYHGCALPTELSRHTLSFSTRMRSTNDLRFTQELSRRTLSFSTRMRYRDVPRTIVANSGDFSNNIYTSSSIAASISSRFDWINGNPTECARF